MNADLNDPKYVKHLTPEPEPNWRSMYEDMRELYNIGIKHRNELSKLVEALQKEVAELEERIEDIHLDYKEERD